MQLLQRKIEEPDFYLVVELKYDKGGMNYFSGKVEERGYKLCVSTQNIVTEGIFVTRSITPMASHNFRVLLKRVKRYSDKQFQALKEKVEKHLDKIYELYKEDPQKAGDYILNNLVEV